MAGPGLSAALRFSRAVRRILPPLGGKFFHDAAINKL